MSKDATFFLRKDVYGGHTYSFLNSLKDTAMPVVGDRVIIARGSTHLPDTFVVVARQVSYYPTSTMFSIVVEEIDGLFADEVKV